ncbi:hypothetical protein ANO11243_012760 [Dothideomycetidae sp. 11243]|nr:hypothetical protein ANO11243_012760 [fungal sp. No.11243]
MTKKHKAKAKGNQPKPHMRKSFRDTPSRDSSGPPTPFFTLRDEVRNTDRHSSIWAPSVELRKKPVMFVSAGTIQPLEEPVTYQKEKDEADRNADTTLDTNEGAMAQLKIESPQNSSVDLDVNMESAHHPVAVESTDHVSVELVDRADTSDLFVVDCVGDDSLKPAGPSPIFRDAPLDRMSDSEGEVILFKGRRDPVVVHDDLVAPAHSHDTPMASESISLPLPVVDRVSATTGLDRTKAVSTFDQSSPRAKKKSLKAGRRHRAGKSSWSTRNPHQHMHDDDGIDEEVYLDYLANISGGEELLALRKGVDDDDEWTSSAMDETEQDQHGENITSVNSTETGKANLAIENNKNLGRPDVIEDHNDDYDDDDDVDDDDDDGTSDPGDDSDLESDLEYTAQERWEDEADLRQRQIDALTDEEIARILAKQEDLGMGSDEIILLDDAGFGDVSRAQKKAGRKNGHFPSASVMADVLEQDPYGGFDVMDFERPSLRKNTKGNKGRKSVGPLPEELIDLSDSDLIDGLQSAWANDREKKAARKAEREELRAQGLLGRKNKFKADLAIKFCDGMSLNDVRSELEEFLFNTANTTKAFPPMEKRERKLLHEIAHVFELTSNSRGNGKNRFTVLSKRARTPAWDEARWERVLRISTRGFLRGAGKESSGRGTPRAGRGGGFSKSAVSYANGEVVGAAAPEIAATSFGHQLMLKMGWEKGQALGKGGEGMLVPVEARIKSGRGGLG